MPSFPAEDVGQPTGYRLLLAEQLMLLAFRDSGGRLVRDALLPAGRPARRRPRRPRRARASPAQPSCLPRSAGRGGRPRGAGAAGRLGAGSRAVDRRPMVGQPDLAGLRLPVAPDQVAAPRSAPGWPAKANLAAIRGTDPIGQAVSALVHQGGRSGT